MAGTFRPVKLQNSRCGRKEKKKQKALDQLLGCGRRTCAFQGRVSLVLRTEKMSRGMSRCQFADSCRRVCVVAKNATPFSGVQPASKTQDEAQVDT